MDFLLGNLAIGLGHVPHHLESRANKRLSGPPRIQTTQVNAASTHKTFIELMTEIDAKQESYWTTEDQTQKTANQLADKCEWHQLHPSPGRPHRENIRLDRDSRRLRKFMASINQL